MTPEDKELPFEDDNVEQAFEDYWNALKPEYRRGKVELYGAFKSGYWEGYNDCLAEEVLPKE